MDAFSSFIQEADSPRPFSKDPATWAAELSALFSPAGPRPARTLHVVAGRRQGASRLVALRQPLVGCRALRDRRGLTTSPIPYRDGAFEIAFDFLDHQLRSTQSRPARGGAARAADGGGLHHATMRALADLGSTCASGRCRSRCRRRSASPTIAYRSHDADARRSVVARARVGRLGAEGVPRRVLGKSSPVHFWWGAFDLSVTRFSGRRAPERPGADAIMREGHRTRS